MLNHVKPSYIYIYSYIIFSKHVPYSWAWQLLAPLHDSKASRLPPTAPWSQKSAGYCSLASLGRRCIHQCPGCKWVWYLQELWEFMGGCISWGFVISGSEDDEEQVGAYIFLWICPSFSDTPTCCHGVPIISSYTHSFPNKLATFLGFTVYLFLF